MGRVQLPNGPIYVPKDLGENMQAPEWRASPSLMGPYAFM